MFKSLKDFDFKSKRVLVRVDFNVPLDEEGNITNDKRIRESLPTIKKILEQNSKQIILMSHMGKPKGEVVEKLKLDNVGKKLHELLGQEVAKLDDCVDIEIPDKKIILLENLRFHPEEKKNDQGFAKKLASHADVYVNDAFGTCHRAHASVDAITNHLPACAGLLVEKEINVMGDALKDPKKPFIAILGGVKLETKIPVIENILGKVDKMLLGGAMVYTFYKSMGLEIGKSVFEEDKVELARKLLDKGKGKIVLPNDVVIANEFKEYAESKIVSYDAIPPDWMGVDIGPKTLEEYGDMLKEAKTVVWNGPMGVFEMEKFADGTKKIAQILAELDAVVIIGGGDSAAAIEKLNLQDKVTHVSTGGGASLEFLSGKTLPAIKALEDNAKKFK